MTNFYDLFAKQVAPREHATVTPLDPARATRYATKALNSECENVAAAADGTRNDTLNRAAFNISQLVAAGHLPHLDAWDALTSAARLAGLPEHEIRGTLASGFKAGADQPRIVPDQPPPPAPTVLITNHTTDTPAGVDAETGELVGPPLNPIIDWHELFATEDEGEEWIVEPLLPARRMVALYSAPKAGKSLLMLEVAVGIARGTEVIGTTPDRPRRVLYVDFENDPRGDVRARLEAMNIGPGELDGLCYLTYPSLAKFDTQQGALDLLRHVHHYECEVVVIDTVSRAVGGEENENDTWLSFYRHTGLALKQNEIACIRLDHSGKDVEKGMRGGSAKYGDVDAVWRLTALSEGTVHLECTDNRMPIPTKTLTLNRDEFPLVHKLANGEAWKAANDARSREADDALTALGVPPSTSVRDAKIALREAGHKLSNKAIEDAVRIRKMRLDLPPTSVPGTPPGHSGTPGGSVPGTPPPLGGVRDTPSRRPGTSGDTPTVEAVDNDTLVSCTKCFRPTTHGVATRFAGMCATCHRDTGGVA